MAKQRVVILGGGFAGLGTALHLARHARGIFDIVLVDREEQHLYTPWLYKLPSDVFLGREHQKHRDCHFCFSELTERYADIRFRQAEVVGHNKSDKHILLKDGHTLAYDYLVVAIGSVTNFYGIQGAKEYSASLKTVDSVKHVADLFSDFAQGISKTKKQIVIVGGGATGTESALEIGYISKRLGLQDNISVHIVDARPSLLGAFSKFVQKSAKRRARKLGIHVHASAIATEVLERKIDLKYKDGDKESLAYDLLFWSAGCKPSPVLSQMKLPIDERGRILVDGSLAVQGEECIFALGDSSAFFDHYNDNMLPPAAWVAVDHASIAARNIIGHHRGHTMTKYKPPRMYPGVISLGGPHAVGGAAGIEVSGLFGYLIKTAIDLRYFLSIMPFFKAWGSWFSKRKTCDV